MGMPTIDDRWEIKTDDVTLEQELSQGFFGKVYKGTWQRIVGCEPVTVAVKTLHENASEQDRSSFLCEIAITQHFNSSHVVRFHGIVSKGRPVMAVMELMDKGDLKTYLRSIRPRNEGPFKYRNFPLSEQQLMKISSQIVAGMAYVTALKFVHRDLAARNCMVSGNLNVKIGDFGLSRDIYSSDYHRKTRGVPLPVRWMSPESLRDGIFNQASDIWSFGIVLWEVATLATQPYPRMSSEQVLRFVIGGGVMDVRCIKHVPNMHIHVMKKCWLHNPTDRPTFEYLESTPPVFLEQQQ